MMVVLDPSLPEAELTFVQGGRRNVTELTCDFSELSLGRNQEFVCQIHTEPTGK